MSLFNSFIRVPAMVLRHRIHPYPPMRIMDTDRVMLRVWPQDIDWNMHMNNSRYQSYMDYGRFRAVARCRVMDRALGKGWAPLVGGVLMTFRRSLHLWERYALDTRIRCWDDRWFYIEQNFYGREGLATTAWVKGLFRDRTTGNVPPQRLLESVEPGIVSPPMPRSIVEWNESTRDQLAGANAAVKP
jgi:acyl-CoA thioesterase FadM